MKISRYIRRFPTPVLCLVLAYLTTLGVSVNLDWQDTSEGTTFSLLASALSGVPITHASLLLGFLAIYLYITRKLSDRQYKSSRRDRVCVFIPAALFAAFMVVGYSFYKDNSWYLILGSGLQKIKALLAWTGYFILFSFLISFLYAALPNLRLFDTGLPKAAKPNLIGKYWALLEKHPFRTSFVTILILYIPYAILSYPVIFMGDTDNMIRQGFNVEEATSNYLNLIDENVKLNGHHPIAYTVFIHLCLLLGNAVFSSYNAGIFLVALSQLVTMAAAFSISVKYMVSLQMDRKWIIAILLYYIFTPRIQNYMFLITKDTFAAAVLLLFYLVLFQITRGNPGKKKNVFLCCFYSAVFCLLRNDAKYILLASMIFFWIFDRRHRGVWLRTGIVVSLTAILVSHVIMPAFSITPGSVREMLSVPFQQTARYVRDCGDELTQEERDAISAVLDLDTIGENYTPTSADAVKATYNEDATTEDLLAYFKVWFQMGLKHPGVYLQATLNNYYNYFYAGEQLANNYSYSWSIHCMELANNKLAELGVQFSAPEVLSELRTKYESLRENIFTFPILNLLKSTAFYVWVLILLVFYQIKQRSRRGLLLTVPLLLSLGVCLLGPCNGEYFRYLFGVSVCLPTVFLAVLAFNAEERANYAMLESKN